MKSVRDEALSTPSQLMISMDAKATVKVGDFSRGGMNPVPVKALDHDFGAEATLTPVGMLLPELGELHLAIVESKVTADCLVDQLEALWDSGKRRWSSIDTLVVLLDNGPECNSHRRQFMERIVQFADRIGRTIRLAYYPPYHSKYNPVERCWGVLENHWGGALLNSIEKVVGYAKTMTWRGNSPAVSVVDKIYETGVTLSDEAMGAVESRLDRHATLGTWFVDIVPASNR